MKTKKSTLFIFFPALALLGFLTLPGAALATTYNFTITLENFTNNVLTPAPFITHDSSFDLFSGGTAASSQVEMLAEDGITTGILDLAMAAQTGGSVLDYKVAANGGPIIPGTSATVNILADTSHNLLSFMSMLAFSNDAFIGGTTGDGAISLFSGDSPILNTYYISPNHVWDAGTEFNDELAANVPALMGVGSVDENAYVTQGHLGLFGTGDIPLDRNWLGDSPVATITISAASPVPEPATLLLFGTGLLGLAGISRRKSA